MKPLTFLALPVLALLLTSCEKDRGPQVTREFSTRSFSEISAGDNHDIKIIRDSVFHISASGGEEDVEDLLFDVYRDRLNICFTSFDKRREQVRITIRMPEIKELELKGNAACELSGFNQNAGPGFYISGNSSCRFSGDISEMDMDVSGTSSMVISGSIKRINANLSGMAEVDATGISGNRFTGINASGQAKATLMATDTLQAQASGQALIFYKGEPKVKSLQASGQSMIISL